MFSVSSSFQTSYHSPFKAFPGASSLSCIYLIRRRALYRSAIRMHFIFYSFNKFDSLTTSWHSPLSIKRRTLMGISLHMVDEGDRPWVMETDGTWRPEQADARNESMMIWMWMKMKVWIPWNGEELDLVAVLVIIRFFRFFAGHGICRKYLRIDEKISETHPISKNTNCCQNVGPCLNYNWVGLEKKLEEEKQIVYVFVLGQLSAENFLCREE